MSPVDPRISLMTLLSAACCCWRDSRRRSGEAGKSIAIYRWVVHSSSIRASRAARTMSARADGAAFPNASPLDPSTCQRAASRACIQPAQPSLVRGAVVIVSYCLAVLTGKPPYPKIARNVAPQRHTPRAAQPPRRRTCGWHSSPQASSRLTNYRDASNDVLRDAGSRGCCR